MGGAGVCLLGCGNAPFAPHLWIPAFAGMTLRGVGDAAMVRGGVSPPVWGLAPPRSPFDFPQGERPHSPAPGSRLSPG